MDHIMTRLSSSSIVLIVYRPGSSAVTVNFNAELGEVLDRLSTFVDAIVLADDVNIRLECKFDPQSACGGHSTSCSAEAVHRLPASTHQSCISPAPVL